ncbi:hypothetical protein MKW98_013265 [Papaver atlanticum]|uniref:Replication factor A C-terminal domain-containing protein n=1 Tax=Papaver atlanticum TaxID=357466 RepID=A0AAD4SFN1_9MAGN|nr:hypothetical protein MKW98_013265 [Papaver atlanticum]
MNHKFFGTNFFLQVVRMPRFAPAGWRHVVGVLTSHTNLQHLKRSTGNACFMRELTLENIRGMKLKVTLWGESTSELTRNLEAHGMNPQPVVAVVVLHIRERSSHRTPPREITLPARVGYDWANQSIADTKKTISQLLETKCASGYNVLNRKVCGAKAIGISTQKGWYYLGCHNCTTKLVGNIGDYWCPSCKVQIDEPVPRSYADTFSVWKLRTHRVQPFLLPWTPKSKKRSSYQHRMLWLRESLN